MQFASPAACAGAEGGRACGRHTTLAWPGACMARHGQMVQLQQEMHAGEYSGAGSTTNLLPTDCYDHCHLVDLDQRVRCDRYGQHICRPVPVDRQERTSAAWWSVEMFRRWCGSEQPPGSTPAPSARRHWSASLCLPLMIGHPLPGGENLQPVTPIYLGPDDRPMTDPCVCHPSADCKTTRTCLFHSSKIATLFLFVSTLPRDVRSHAPC